MAPLLLGGVDPTAWLLDSPHLRLSRGLASISAFSRPPTGLAISGMGTPKKESSDGGEKDQLLSSRLV